MADPDDYPQVMSPFHDNASVAGGVELPSTRNAATPFRPEAPIFDPHGKMTFLQSSAEISREATQSPWYPMPASTFLPPETPYVAPAIPRQQELLGQDFHRYPRQLRQIDPRAIDSQHQMDMAFSFNPITQQFANDHDSQSLKSVQLRPNTTMGNYDNFWYAPENTFLASPSPQRSIRQNLVSRGFDTEMNVALNNTIGIKLPHSNTSSNNGQVTTTQRHNRHVSSGPLYSQCHDDMFVGPSKPRSQSLHVITQDLEAQASAAEEYDFKSAPFDEQTSSNSSNQRPTASSNNGQGVPETSLDILAEPIAFNCSSTVEKLPERARAKYLADLIRSGLVEDSRDFPSGSNHPYHSRQISNSSGGFSVPTTPTTLRLAAPPKSIGPDALVQQYMLTGRPTLEDAFNHIPLVEECRRAQAAVWGVIRISDIPYGTTKPEVVAALGRNSRIAHMPLGSPFFAIHIIMERSTAKSMDCFVEFETVHEAQYAVQRFKSQISNGHHPRIGDRKIQMEVVGQEILMKELFPKAKCVKWKGQVPVIHIPEEGLSSRFNGFVTGEEMVMTIKFAECPQRSRFAQRHEQRVYESVISLLAKYPWFEVNSCTIEERDKIFDTTFVVTRALADQLRQGFARRPLTIELLQELLHSGLTCPGFSEMQRFKLAEITKDLVGASAYISPLAIIWPFDMLKCKVDASEELVMYFVTILREASTTTTSMTLTHNGAQYFNLLDSPFGNFCMPPIVDKRYKTYAQLAREEWEMVENALRRVL